LISMDCPASLSDRTLLGEARRPVQRLWWTAAGAGGRDLQIYPKAVFCLIIHALPVC